ncbi:hypothetical protein LDENG_00005410, partial [Lucifuga dentata]
MAARIQGNETDKGNRIRDNGRKATRKTDRSIERDDMLSRVERMVEEDVRRQ